MFSTNRADARLLDQIFNLRFTSKQLVKTSKKCEKEEKEEKAKVGVSQPERASSRECALRARSRQVKRAIEKGNIDGARIYAQNAIRKKNEARGGRPRRRGRLSDAPSADAELLEGTAC